jgi:hypothetical protein
MTKQPKPTTNNPPADDDDPGEFAAFKTHDALAAYLYAKHGEAMLREVFRTDGTFARESLEDCADELDARSLDQVAAVMRDIAKQCPSGLDLHNPYDPDDGYNWSEWRRFWLLKRREQTGELRAFLLRHHAQKQRQTQAQQAEVSHTRR